MFIESRPAPIAIPRQTPIQAKECEMMNNVHVRPSYFAHNDVLAVPSGELWSVGPFALMYHQIQNTTKFIFADSDIHSIASHSPDTLLLGVERPSRELVAFDFWNNTIRSVIPLNSTSLKSYSLSLKAMTIYSKIPQNTDKFEILVADIHASIYTLEANLRSQRSSTVGTVRMVDKLPGSVVARGLIDDVVFKEITSLHYERGLDMVFVLFGPSRTLRAFSMSSGTMQKYVHFDSFILYFYFILISFHIYFSLFNFIFICHRLESGSCRGHRPNGQVYH
jgi:hypothetical protein